MISRGRGKVLLFGGSGPVGRLHGWKGQLKPHGLRLSQFHIPRPGKKAWGWGWGVWRGIAILGIVGVGWGKAREKQKG